MGTVENVADAMDYFKRAQLANMCKKTARERRCEREPEQVKALRRDIRECTNNKVKQVLQARLFKCRIHVLSVRRCIMQQKTFMSTKKICKAKPLHKLESMLVPASCESLEVTTTFSVDVFAELVFNEYNTKWGCTDSVFKNDNIDTLQMLDGTGVNLDIDDLHRAFSRLKRPHKLDAHGICIGIIRFFTLEQPQQALCFFNKLATSNSWMASLGIVQAKSGHQSLQIRPGASCLARLF